MSLEAYQADKRLGESVPLDRLARHAIWKRVELFRQLSRERGGIDHVAALEIVLNKLASSPGPRHFQKLFVEALDGYSTREQQLFSALADKVLPLPAHKGATPPRPRAEVIRERQRRALTRFEAALSNGSSASAVNGDDLDEPTGALRVVFDTELDPVRGKARGLILEIGPLDELPSFIESLAVSNQTPPVQMFADNARSAVFSVPVQPTHDDYALVAVDYDELGDALGLRTVPGFAADHASLFVLRSGTRAARLVTQEVPLVLPVIVLVPPALIDVDLPRAHVHLGENWRWFRLQIASGQVLDDDLARCLSALGLTVGSQAVSLSFPLPPIARLTTRSLEAPVFLRQDDVRLRVERFGPAFPVTLLFLHQGESAELALEAGSGTTDIALDGLGPGLWVIDALTGVPGVSARVFVSVSEKEPVPPVADASLSLRGPDGVHQLEFAARQMLSVDLTQCSIEAISLPDGWPLVISWQGRTWRHEATGAAKVVESVLERVCARLNPRDDLDPIGDLVLDAHELGFVRLRHAPVASVDFVFSVIGPWMASQRGVLEATVDAPAQRLDRLVRPLLGRLGLSVSRTAVAELDAPVFLLVRPRNLETSDAGTSSPPFDEGVMMVSPAWFEEGDVAVQRLRGRIGAFRLRAVLVSDGTSWLWVDHRARWPRKPIDLGAAWQGQDESAVFGLIREIDP